MLQPSVFGWEYYPCGIRTCWFCRGVSIQHSIPRACPGAGGPHRGSYTELLQRRGHITLAWGHLALAETAGAFIYTRDNPRSFPISSSGRSDESLAGFIFLTSFPSPLWLGRPPCPVWQESERAAWVCPRGPQREQPPHGFSSLSFYRGIKKSALKT